jgi:hypothetical protein
MEPMLFHLGERRAVQGTDAAHPQIPRRKTLRSAFTRRMRLRLSKERRPYQSMPSSEW